MARRGPADKEAVEEAAEVENLTTGEGDAEDFARKLSLLDELRQAEIRATSSQVASVIGHMIGTPLNVIVGRATLLRANPTPDSMIDNARRIEEQAERLTRRVQRLIQYLTAPEPKAPAQAAGSVLEDALSLYRPIARRRDIVIESHRTSSLDTMVEGTRTLMVLSALLSLAIRTAEPGCVVKLLAEAEAGQHSVLFTLSAPGLEPPEGRVDKMEPPEHYNPDRIEEEQLLAVCAAIMSRRGGRLEVVTGSESKDVEIRLRCAEVGPHDNIHLL